MSGDGTTRAPPADAADALPLRGGGGGSSNLVLRRLNCDELRANSVWFQGRVGFVVDPDTHALRILADPASMSGMFADSRSEDIVVKTIVEFKPPPASE